MGNKWPYVLLVVFQLGHVNSQFPTMNATMTSDNTTMGGIGTGSGGGMTGSGGSMTGGMPIVGGGFPTMPMLQKNPASIKFVGAGYNLVKGNPDGEFWDKVGDDPGLLMSKRILFVSEPTAMNPDPPQLSIVHRDMCHMSHEYNLIYSRKSYQERLREAVRTKGVPKAVLDPYAFTKSHGYDVIRRQVEDHNYVFQDYTTLCNEGHVQFKLSLAFSDHMSVTREFAAAICLLPVHYDFHIYNQFVEEWGTHFISEVEIGKKITYRYQASLGRYMSFVMANSSDNIYMTQDGKYAVNMNNFRYSSEYRDLVGKQHDMLYAGDYMVDDAIEYVINTLDGALDPMLWTGLPQFVQQGICPSRAAANLNAWKENIIKGLQSYPYSVGVAPSDVPKDHDMEAPVTWPSGTYGLMKASSGCPSLGQWAEGYRTQTVGRHTDVSTPNLGISTTSNTLTSHFCMKEQTSNSEMLWPMGDYCIYQLGTCPQGFTSGSIQFNDANNGSANTKGGDLPEGTYNQITIFNFCCRNDGNYFTKIRLPTSSSFYLLKHTHSCQHVHGAIATEEIVTWGSSHTVNAVATGSYPSIERSGGSVTMYFCYYQSDSSLPSIG